ncbi:YdeI/OmpD-associated family protein [Rhodococcus sp. IEGM 1401]|uniref:YdeI/OmpD-associated family protein n=1 Tax=Rhodococcus cerastii TaxID=908616 RepID=A0ABU4D8W5_9NOCA|nr:MULTISPECIES: YdeI/OmpD-associated family protein [Rhodococcus]MCZ4563611.1 YdeI/OmpD-associated family protein [Rhodococcus sp. IEGM 1401]MDI9923779.1 YdeI/OmpD-associated family protein [Rhodococcus sp. IEGM 1372]MDI9927221.1 YdeI/OmpD-associated family protein [Rhodococcus sp. IEGM 1341]MDV6305551.1 YdeI/OmpD-associated family protein [Rhodococcus cerastii]MDV8036272.1 YdeI/OmpD-associated family protein [Rhodococcus sp. IEGM 1414]
MAATALRMSTVLESRGPAAAIVLTDEQVASLGSTKTPPVRFTIGGQTVRGRIGRMGGENLLGLNKSVRATLGVEAGDTVDVTIELDDQPQVIEVPPALATALDADPTLRAAFDALAPSTRKEHARSVADAKRDDTRERRVTAIVQSLRL